MFLEGSLVLMQGGLNQNQECVMDSSGSLHDQGNLQAVLHVCSEPLPGKIVELFCVKNNCNLQKTLL